MTAFLNWSLQIEQRSMFNVMSSMSLSTPALLALVELVLDDKADDVLASLLSAVILHMHIHQIHRLKYPTHKYILPFFTFSFQFFRKI